MSQLSLQPPPNAQPAPDQPSWFTTHKKRTIQNHLEPKKKPGFHINNTKLTEASRRSVSGSSGSDAVSSALSSSKDPFNILSFGPQKKYITSSDRASTYEDTVAEEAPEQPLGEDLPPARSIFDLNDEVLLSLDKPKQHTDSFISKDPKNFNNVFNRTENTAQHARAPPTTTETQSLDNSSAILVFGYPERLASEVIQYFREFGEVLEDFENSSFAASPQTVASARDRAHKKLVPIVSGHSWVKITYSSPASAMDALQENGNAFNGLILGVVPFNKHTVEKVKKRSLTDFEDVGEIDFSKLKPKDQGEIIPENSQYSSRMEIKDGTSFFLQPEDDQLHKGTQAQGEKLGLLSSITKYLFGFHEL